MTQPTLSIPDKKVREFTDLINDIEYVKTADQSLTMPEWQKKRGKKKAPAVKKETFIWYFLQGI